MDKFERKISWNSLKYALLNCNTFLIIILNNNLLNKFDDDDEFKTHYLQKFVCTIYYLENYL